MLTWDPDFNSARIKAAFAVNLDNFSQIFEIFKRFGCGKAIDQCFDFLDYKANDVITNEALFKQLPFDFVTKLIKRPTFQVEEWKKCKALLKWQQANDEYSLKDVMSSIDWTRISVAEMRTHLKDIKDFYFDYTPAHTPAYSPAENSLNHEQSPIAETPEPMQSSAFEQNSYYIESEAREEQLDAEVPVAIKAEPYSSDIDNCYGENMSTDDESNEIEIEAYTEHSAPQPMKRKRRCIWYSKEKSKYLLVYPGPPKTFKCKDCPDQTFSAASNCYRHISTVHFRERRFNCPFCNKNYTSQPMLQRHIQLHHCEICGKFFKTQLQKNSHINREHNVRDECTCDSDDNCDEEMAVDGESDSPNSLTPKRRRMLHSFWFSKEKDEKVVFDWSTRKHVCAICKHTFLRRDSALRHVSINHYGERPFECPVSTCEEKFSHKSELNEHIFGIHYGVQSYDCAVCKKKFVMNCRLEDVLEEGDQFNCSCCDQKFTSKYYLLNHKKAKHRITFEEDADVSQFNNCTSLPGPSGLQNVPEMSA